eukprot:3131757-Prymnesium_polylepis.2
MGITNSTKPGRDLFGYRSTLQRAVYTDQTSAESRESTPPQALKCSGQWVPFWPVAVHLRKVTC